MKEEKKKRGLGEVKGEGLEKNSKEELGEKLRASAS